MKQLYAIFFIILLFQSILAQSASVVAFIIHKSDGTETKIEMADVKEINFDLDTNVDFQKIDGIVAEFQLFNNYPNPFNPTTTITYAIVKESPVDVFIFNISGRLVKSFYNPKQSAGMHSIIWDAKDQSGFLVTSGIYFYQVKCANQILTKRMMFVK